MLIFRWNQLIYPSTLSLSLNCILYLVTFSRVSLFSCKLASFTLVFGSCVKNIMRSLIPSIMWIVPIKLISFTAFFQTIFSMVINLSNLTAYVELISAEQIYIKFKGRTSLRPVYKNLLHHQSSHHNDSYTCRISYVQSMDWVYL